MVSEGGKVPFSVVLDGTVESFSWDSAGAQRCLNSSSVDSDLELGRPKKDKRDGIETDEIRGNSTIRGIL